ncbi:hypothetical protein CYLTODRAFT_424242 [Cylindrobasidium torrendii FP15055 ss-10]|uniref:Uncharacterized protein n=1 Tax=Cylindrobasidium torrendii FP15055 ss-10 TaxID=1314674 RepID=A0A0D7B4S1_9AGAR|nr:hypothetical protein CYLTODRAFT_424242 [Cylindrobasidium torrendii FP15055 ss-10]
MVNSDSYVIQLHRKELALTDDYAAQLKSTIQELESEVDSLERQIAVFEAICRNLHRTLAIPKRALATCRAVLSPIHRLPQELLVAVFQHCITPDYDNASLGDDMRWVLLRVCRSWKRVLEGMPTMWTNLVISPDTRSMTQALELYLLFSAQHPLWVTIHEDEDKLQFRDNWCPAFWEALSSTTHRWERLQIRCESTPVDDIIMHLMPLELPILEEVYVDTGTSDADPGEPSGQERSWFRHAPRLRRVMLYFAGERSYAWYPPSLTHMCSRLEGDGSALEYALSFPNLQELSFAHEDYIMPLRSLRHNGLTYLCASNDTLRYLTLPSLKCLAMADDGPHSPGSWAEDMTTFIHRSKCRLTNLRLLASSILHVKHTYTELLPLLAPTLEMLSLVSDGPSHSDAEKIIRSLTRTESSPGCLPHLKHLGVFLHSQHVKEYPDCANSFVDTLTAALISLRDEHLANQWDAPLLMQVTVNSQNDPLVTKMRMSCLDSLFSRGLEVAYGRDRAIGDRTLTLDWNTTWYDTIRK